MPHTPVFVVMAPAVPGEVPHFAAISDFRTWTSDPKSAWHFKNKRLAEAHRRRMRDFYVNALEVVTLEEGERKAVEASIIPTELDL